MWHALKTIANQNTRFIITQNNIYIMATRTVKKVASFAFYSRLLVILVQAFFNSLMPDHDAKVFNPPTPHHMTFWDDLVTILLGGFRRWDGIYFIHIAEYGYTYENTLAFFPIFPLLIAGLANTLLYPLQLIMCHQSVLMISAAIVNVVMFIMAACVLYKLSIKVLGDEILAYKAAHLFCINPASIFFSAAYSEASFAFFSFLGMLFLEEGSELKAALTFGLSGGTRSNGIANAGFILHKKFKEFFEKLSVLQKTQFNNPKDMVLSLLTLIVTSLWSTIFLLTSCILPFVVYQFFTYEYYCQGAIKHDLPSHIQDYGRQQNYRMPQSGAPKWCFYHLPFSYLHIQSEHWGNGFLNYYQLKQLPNFLLATPMVTICMFGAIMYIRKNTTYCITMGLYDPRDSAHKKSDEYLEQGDAGLIEVGFFNQRCFIYVMHMLMMTLVGVLFMHVQVITRFITSSCPVLYWFIAHVGISQEKLNKLRSKSTAPLETDAQTDTTPPTSDDDVADWDNHAVIKAIFIYFHLYFFVGIAAFANFLPWT